MVTHISSLARLLFDLSSLRWLWEKILPPAPSLRSRPPSTFVVWLVATYVGVYGLATGLYNQEKDALAGRLDFVISTVDVESFQYLITQLSVFQNTEVPLKPEFISFASLDEFFKGLLSPVRSLFETAPAPEIHNTIRTLIEFRLGLLTGKNFENFSFQGYSLTNADLSHSKMRNITLAGATISGMRFNSSELENVDITQVSYDQPVELRNSHVRDSRIDFYLFNPDFPTSIDRDIDFTGTKIINSEIIVRDIYSPPTNNYCFDTVDDPYCYGVDLGIYAPLINTKVEIKDDAGDYYFDRPANIEIGSLCISREEFERLKEKLGPSNSWYRDAVEYKPTCEKISVFFELDRSDLSEEGKMAVKLAADVINGRGCADISLEGHMHRAGGQSYNLALSERLVGTVRNELAALGVDTGYISSSFYGSSQSNSLRRLDWRDRRVDIDLKDCATPEPVYPRPLPTPSLAPVPSSAD